MTIYTAARGPVYTPSGTASHTSYRVSVTAFSVHGIRTVLLRETYPDTRRMAARQLAAAAGWLATRLDPDPYEAPWLAGAPLTTDHEPTDTADVLRTLPLRDAAITALAAGTPYTLRVQEPDATYVLAAHPVVLDTSTPPETRQGHRPAEQKNPGSDATAHRGLRPNDHERHS